MAMEAKRRQQTICRPLRRRPINSHPAGLIAALLVATALAVAGLFILLLQLFVAERLPSSPMPSSSEAEKLWEKHGPQNYDMDVELRGAQPGTVQASKSATAKSRP